MGPLKWIQTAVQIEGNPIQSVSLNPPPKRVTPSGVNAAYGFVEGVGRGEQIYGAYSNLLTTWNSFSCGS